MADSFIGGENDPPGEESVCIEMASQNTEECQNSEKAEKCRIKYRDRLEKARKFLTPDRNLDGNEAEKESADNISLQKLKSEQKNPYEGYALSKKYIGTAVIVNNLDREQPSTKADVLLLSELLRKTGFQTHVFLNCTKSEMNDLRKKIILDESTHEHSSSFVLVVIAHGDEIKNKEYIFDVNGQTVWNVKTVESQLNRVKALNGKPKLIIVEACRGRRHMRKNQNSDRSVSQIKIQGSEDGFNSEDDYDEDEHDENLIREKNGEGNRSQVESNSPNESTDSSRHADMKDQMVCFATVPEYVALTLTKSGSAYLQMLAKTLKTNMYREQLIDIHTQVTRDLANKPVTMQKEEYQVPQYRSTFDKQFNIGNYLFGKKGESEVAMKGHVYFKCMSKDSIIGQGYSILRNQVKHYNVFERCNYVSEYEDPKGEQKIDIYFIPNGAQVMRESTDQSYLEYMPNPAKKSGMATITFHKEFRTARIHFKENCTGNGKSYTQSFSCGDSKFSHHFKTSLKLDVKTGASQELTEKNLEDFFDFWDNNFVVSHYMGGSVTVTILVNANSKMLKGINKEEGILKDHMDKVFSETAVNGENMHKDLKVVNIEFQGGIIEDVPENFEEVTQSQISSWIKSIPINPIPLTSEMTLAPVHLAVAEVDSQKGELILYEERKRREKEVMKKGRETNEGRETMDKNGLICGSKLVQYIGDMEKNQMHGDGRGYFENGDVYIGQWREGKPEGLGTWYYKEEKQIFRLRGIFKDGEIINTLSGKPKKKIYEKRSFRVKSVMSFFALIALSVMIGWEFWPPAPTLYLPTCTERIYQDWKSIYYRNGRENTWTYKKLEISSLGQSTQSFCNGTTVYIDYLPFPSDSCSAISIPNDDSQSHVYEFKFPENLTDKIPYPQWDKQFRIRSCKAGTNCKTSITNSTNFFCITSPTCTQRIYEEWEKIFSRNGQEHTLARAYMKFKMSSPNLNNSTLGFCNGATVYIDDLPYIDDSDLNCPNVAIPDNDSRSRVYEFNFPQKLETGLILYPHGDKQFRIRSCKAGTNCKTSLANSTDFICVHNSLTMFRDLTCPETIVDNWQHIAFYNKTSATLRVDLTNLPDRCHLSNQPVYMDVVAVDKEYAWPDCRDITSKYNTKAFSQKFKFDKTTEIQEIKFFSGRFIIRFNQEASYCERNDEVGYANDCKHYECTPMLTHYDRQGNDIFQVWQTKKLNSVNIDNIRNMTEMETNPGNSTHCTLNLKHIPLNKVFLETSYLTALVNFSQVNTTQFTCPYDKDYNMEKFIIEKIWVTKSSTYINSSQIYQVGGNSTYRLTIRPNYPFCGHSNFFNVRQCDYQMILKCSNCECYIVDLKNWALHCDDHNDVASIMLGS